VVGATGAAASSGRLTCAEERRINEAVPDFAVRSDCVDWPMFRGGPLRTGASESEQTLTRSNVDSLTQRWKNGVDGTYIYSSPVVANGRVFIAGFNQMVAVDADTGSTIWTFDPPGYGVSTATVVGPNVYFTAIDGDARIERAYALDAATGSQLWGVVLDEASNRNSLRSNPAVVDGRLYVGGFDGRLHALDAGTGAEIWSASVGTSDGQWVSSSPAVADGRVIIGCRCGGVFAFDAETGASLWTSNFGGGATDATPVIAGDRVITQGDGLRALDIATGEQMWYRGIGGISSPAVQNGVVYTASGRNVSAVSLATGQVIWESDYVGEVDFESSPAVANGVVYVGTVIGPSSLYAFSTADGAALWTVNIGPSANGGGTGGGVLSSPAIVDGVLYVGTEVSPSNTSGLYAFGLPW